MALFQFARTMKWTAVALICAAIILMAGLLILAKRGRGSEVDAAATPPLMNKPLPPANLVDSSGTHLDDRVLRQGRVVLVFVAPDCRPCGVESEFLKTLINSRKDVTFYGVISFGATEASIKTVDKEFPFKTYFDREPRLAGALGLYRVPIKIFIEDGIIRKSWKGASTDESSRAEFSKWLEGLR